MAAESARRSGPRAPRRAALLGLLALLGCGYRSGQMLVPRAAGGIFVEPFVDEGPHDLGVPLARHLRLRLASAGAAASSRRTAGAHLGGTLTLADRIYADSGQRRAIAPAVELDACLRGAGGAVVWRQRLALDRLAPQALDGPGGWAAAEAQRQTLLEQMAEAAAEAIWEAMVASELGAGGPG